MKLTISAALLLPSLAFAGPQEEIATKVPQAKAILDAYQAKDPARAEKKVHIVYWTPADREPAPRYRERLDAIMSDIRDFYAREMKGLGFGPMTIHLDHASDGLLKVHVVKGRKPYADYNVDSGGPIRNECLTTLRSAGIDPEKETIVIFCNMSNWDEGKALISQNSPYYAGGSNRSGTAWQVDSPILNLDSLAKKEPRVKDGQYGDISIGRYNSIFIGGICHELGHALGLPHNRARKDEAEVFGTALMGDGNRTYGENLRGEGKGSFLSLAHGLKLASHPIFCGSVKGIDLPANAKLDELKMELKGEGKGFRFSGKVTADPPPYAVLGYMDPEGGGDYDATTCTAIPDAQGKFTLDADAFPAGKAGVFRVVVVQANGAASSFAGASTPYTFPYLVAKDGKLDISASAAQMLLKPLMEAAGKNDLAAAASELAKVEAAKPAAGVLEAARVLAVKSTQGPAPAEASGDKCSLPEAATKSAKVGWGRAAINRFPESDVLFSCGSQLFARGIYAHAPARHVWDLGGKWQSLSGHAGIPDARDGGSCVFVVKADGKELWRTKKTEPGTLRSFKLDVSGVKELELIVEDAGDGNGSDWGCWFEPELSASR